MGVHDLQGQNMFFSHPSNFCDTFENQLIYMQIIISIEYNSKIVERKKPKEHKAELLHIVSKNKVESPLQIPG